MGEDDLSDSDYIDELTGLVEPTGNLMFTTTESKLTIEVNELTRVGHSIAVLVLITCLLGLANGLDFTFNGHVYDDQGEPIDNATVYISWYEGDFWNTSSTETSGDGFFEIELLDPGITRVDIIVDRNDFKDRYSNRVLLSPPALFEPIGFTSIDFNIPSQQTFADQPCADGTTNCTIREIDNSAKQMDHPLMDSGASMIYSTIGIGFVSLAVIAAGFAIWSMKTGSVYLLRTASVLSFFTMGHYYSACMFSLVAFILTFTISKPRRTLK